MADRPGVMIYFDLNQSLEFYSSEEKGQLLQAILDYGDAGIIPEFSDRGMMTLWNGIRSKIDRDAVKYEETCKKRKYSAYCKYIKQKNSTPMSYEQWKDIDGMEEYEVMEDDRTN